MPGWRKRGFKPFPSRGKIATAPDGWENDLIIPLKSCQYRIKGFSKKVFNSTKKLSVPRLTTITQGSSS